MFKDRIYMFRSSIYARILLLIIIFFSMKIKATIYGYYVYV